MAFCKEYNAATQDKVGTVIPVEITVFEVRQSTLCLITCHIMHLPAITRNYAARDTVGVILTPYAQVLLQQIHFLTFDLALGPEYEHELANTL